MENVVYLHGQPKPVAQFVRAGGNGHRQLELMLAAGRLSPRRWVLDAGSFSKQADLIIGLRDNGMELVLDPNVAELSSMGRYQGSAQGAEWADPESMLTPRHFRNGANDFDVVGRIARFAVKNGLHRVLAPSHFLTGVKDGWFAVDRASCELLRRRLNIEGGRDIAIDYPLMVPNAVLNDPAERKAFISSLADLPFDSLWLRISGFGADATAQGLRKYISASDDFHSLRKPIVADGVGGLSALAITSFGAACGVTHGVAGKEKFDTSKWNKPPSKGGGGGGYTVMLAGIDRLLKKEEAEMIMNSAGGRRLCGCQDRACCPHGAEDTLKDPKGHYLRQRTSQYEAISKVPAQLRAKHFLENDLTTADRLARQVAKLRLPEEGLSEMLTKNSTRLDRMRAVLEDLLKTSETTDQRPTLPPPPSKNKKQVQQDRQ